MSNIMFASIYIGSYEVNLKILEFNQKRKVHEVEYIQSRLDLGKSAFARHLIDYEMVDELCLILNEFKQIIDSYHITDYRVYGSSLFHEIKNGDFVIDQIWLRTQMEVQLLSNSEQRFLTYEAVAGHETFEKLIKTSAAFVDVGGTSVQVTLFKKGELLTTQHLDIGTIRLRGLLHRPGLTQEHYQKELEEYIDKKLEVFRALYLPEGIDYLIFVSDYGEYILRAIEKDTNKLKELFKTEKFNKYTEKLLRKPIEEITEELNLPEERDPLVIPAIQIFRQLMRHTAAREVWFPGIDINDGIAYDYAFHKKLIRKAHDFDADVITASTFLSNHYHSFSPHIEALRQAATQIFDATRKVHGLGARERLLLEVAVILHDCGKYISFNDSPESAYMIIMNSEIIGLSHRDRQIVADTVLANKHTLEPYEAMADRIDREGYLTIAKLSAIFKVANALDQSHRQKFRNTRIALKNRELVITVEAMEDISLEQQLFASKTAYFENVFSIKPVLKAKRIYKVEK